MILQNFSQHDIGLCHYEIGSAIVPMGKEGKNEEGRDIIVPGEADVPDALMGALKDNPAVQFYFSSGKLVKGEAKNPASDSAALKAAQDAADAATAKLASATDAKSKTAAQAELDAANAALAALQ